MKLVNIQIAVFYKEKIDRPDLFANRVNSRMNNIFDAMPQILNLPDGAPEEIPVVQMKSSDEVNQFNISKIRCDLIISPELLPQTSLSACIASNQDFIISYLKSVFEEKINIVRVGIIATAFMEHDDAANYISEKYISSTGTFKEAKVRINKSENIGTIELNNIIEVSDGNLVNEKLGLQQKGIVITRDVNNVPSDDVVILLKDAKNILKHAIACFTDKTIGELNK